MKTNILFTAAIACTLALASCDKSSEREISGPDAAPVAFTTLITRTSTDGNSWVNDDRIGVWMVANATSNVVEATSNRAYKTVTGSLGAFSPVTAATDVIYYPLSGSAVDFVAYYPYTAAASGGTYSIDVSTAKQADPSKIDLMRAATRSTTPAGYTKASAGNVAMTFQHMLTKLTITTSAGTGVQASDLPGMNVAIKGMNTKATFDILAGGAPTGAGTPAAIIPRTVTDGAAYQAIVLPRTFAAGELTVEFTINPSSATPETFTWNVGAITLAAGSEHAYAVTLDRTGVKVTGTINPWGTGTGGGPVSAE